MIPSTGKLQPEQFLQEHLHHHRHTVGWTLQGVDSYYENIQLPGPARSKETLNVYL